MRHTGICSIGIAAAMLLLSGCNHESADWKAATAANTMDSYQQFLKQHPGSSYAPAADARIKEMMTDQDWQTAASTDTREAYEAFIANHADSKWVQEAKIRIENFAPGASSSGGPATVAADKSPGVAADNAAQSAAEPATEPSAAPPKPTVKPAATTSATRAPTLVAKQSPKSHTASAPASTSASNSSHANGHGHVVQLGAYSTRERAQSEWKSLAAKFPAQLKSLKPDYQPVKSKGGMVYRLRVPVASAEAASGLCGTLKKHAQTCVVVART
jgi:cell division septation protein DedD